VRFSEEEGEQVALPAVNRHQHARLIFWSDVRARGRAIVGWLGCEGRSSMTDLRRKCNNKKWNDFATNQQKTWKKPRSTHGPRVNCTYSSARHLFSHHPDSWKSPHQLQPRVWSKLGINLSDASELSAHAGQRQNKRAAWIAQNNLPPVWVLVRRSARVRAL